MFGGELAGEFGLFGAGWLRRSGTGEQRSTGVEDGGEIDRLLEQRARCRRQPPQGRDHHGDQRKAHVQQHTLTGDGPGPPTYRDRLGDPVEAVDGEDGISRLRGRGCAPRGDRDDERPIVVCVDGSAASSVAVRWALAQAAERAAPLHLVHAYAIHVTPPGPPLVGYYASLRHSAE
jgi:hypothetical protein